MRDTLMMLEAERTTRGPIDIQVSGEVYPITAIQLT